MPSTFCDLVSTTWVLSFSCIMIVWADQLLQYERLDNSYINHAFQTIFLSSAMACCAACTPVTRCASVSFARGNNTCHLNDRATDDFYGATVLSSASWISFNIAPCSSGWIRYGRNCYFVLTPAVTWSDAEKYCVSLGGHLADVKDENENLFLVNAMGQVTRFWIGLNDLENEGTYVYTSLATVTYTNYHTGEPSHSTEHCIEIWGVRWNDVSCGIGRSAICEKGHF